MNYGPPGSDYGDVILDPRAPDTQREAGAVTKSQYETLVAAVTKLQAEVRELRSVMQSAQRGEARHVSYWQETNE